MNGVVVFIVGLIAGVMGGCAVTLFIDGIHRDRILVELEKIYKDLDKMDDHLAIDISDLHNDIGKTAWLNDMTINGLQNQIDELKRTVDYYRRWSLGCWNDIRHASDNVVEKANELTARFDEVEDNFYNCVKTFEYRVKPDDIPGNVELDPEEDNQPTFNTLDNTDVSPFGCLESIKTDDIQADWEVWGSEETNDDE